MQQSKSQQEFSSAQDKVNYRQKGKNIDGKVCKGFIQEASQKTSVGTIPAKFETIIYKNENKKAFLSSTGRFFTAESAGKDIPGPGSYVNGQQNIPQPVSISQESLSKKGFGNGFLSNCQRDTFLTKYKNQGPCVGQYNILENAERKSLIKTRSSNIKGSSMFLSKNRNTKSQNFPRVQVENPGPGEYNPKMLKARNTYNSAFFSRTNRAQYLQIKEGPAPTEYNIRKNIVKAKPFKHIGNSADFQAPTTKKTNKNNMQELIQYLNTNNSNGSNANLKNNHIIGQTIDFYDEKKSNLGPGCYNPKFSDFKPDYICNQQNSIFQQSNKDRFGDFVDKNKIKKDYLGPTTYKVEEYGLNKYNYEKAQQSGSVFISETARKPYGEFDKKQGPNMNIPYLPAQKKSFHLFLGRAWL